MSFKRLEYIIFIKSLILQEETLFNLYKNMKR
jgi:hypothetical protein